MMTKTKTKTKTKQRKSAREFKHLEESLADYAMRVGVRPGHRLANTVGGLAEPIREFFRGTENHVGSGRTYQLSDLADTLNEVGVRSASGLEVTSSHVSNARRKADGIRCSGEYSKPGYAGRNWITG